MKKNLLLLIVIACISRAGLCQQTGDSSTNLSEVIVKAFQQNKQLRQSSAAINVINKQMLARTGSSSILQAMNSTAGVRMEERSPGSYRMNIRGSTLRS